MFWIEAVKEIYTELKNHPKRDTLLLVSLVMGAVLVTFGQAYVRPSIAEALDLHGHQHEKESLKTKAYRDSLARVRTMEQSIIIQKLENIEHKVDDLGNNVEKLDERLWKERK